MGLSRWGCVEGRNGEKPYSDQERYEQPKAHVLSITTLPLFTGGVEGSFSEVRGKLREQWHHAHSGKGRPAWEERARKKEAIDAIVITKTGV